MKHEEVIELEALRIEVGRYRRETRAVDRECAALMRGPATPTTRERARQIQREMTAREERYEVLAYMVLDLLARPFDAEGLPS